MIFDKQQKWQLCVEKHKSVESNSVAISKQRS